MNIENVQAQMRKGILEFCIISIIAKKKECYTSEIIEQLKAGNLLIVEGTLYPLLTRLKNDGILTYQWQESTSGPPRKYYSLTPEGISFKEALNNTWLELLSTVNNITSNTL